MKLNIKQTLKVGLPFMTIMLLWGVYNWYIPLFLNDFLEGLFKGDDLVIGIVMALDNLVALFMIPLMSNLSDKTSTKIGKRMPFIIVGMGLSIVFFALIPFTYRAQKIWALIVNIVLVLLSMNIYRSPAVALMPDITPKKLRGKANSFINILGGVGTALAYLFILVLGSTSDIIPFSLVCVVMVLVLIYISIFIKENNMVKEYKAILKANNISIEDDKEEEKVEGKVLKTNVKNVLLSLLIVFLVYMANNSVETFMSMYSDKVFAGVQVFKDGSILNKLDLGILVFVPFGIGTFAFSYPAGYLGDKKGRKLPILLGTFIMSIAYIGISIIGYQIGFSLLMMLFFLIGGLGFALVVINIYPLVIENCSSTEVGKYTGYYYSASMIAQSITPALVGLFMSALVFNDVRVLFPYASIFMILALVTTLFIKKEN